MIQFNINSGMNVFEFPLVAVVLLLLTPIIAVAQLYVWGVEIVTHTIKLFEKRKVAKNVS